MFLVESKPRASVKAGHVLVVRCDDLIEQRLLGLDQESRNKRVSLLSGKALECQGVVSSSQLSEMLGAVAA